MAKRRKGSKNYKKKNNIKHSKRKGNYNHKKKIQNNNIKKNTQKKKVANKTSQKGKSAKRTKQNKTNVTKKNQKTIKVSKASEEKLNKTRETKIKEISKEELIAKKSPKVEKISDVKKTSHKNDFYIIEKEGHIFHANLDNTYIGELDLKPSAEKTPIKKKKRHLKKLPVIIICLVFVAGFGCFLYSTNIKNHQPNIDKIDKENSEIQPEETNLESQPEETNTVVKDSKLEQVQKFYQENNDLTGWLQIDGTKIDYPVMYTKGKDFYLRRDFYGNAYEAGTLYIDKHNTVEPRDTNLIIHGHNMNNGTMFHDLLKYKDQAFYNNHRTLTYYTLDEKQNYEIIAVFLSKVYNVDDNVFKYYKFYNATNASEYNYFIRNIKSLALYETNVTASFGEDLITLSTCEYSQENGRLVVVAKKIMN